MKGKNKPLIILIAIIIILLVGIIIIISFQKKDSNIQLKNGSSDEKVVLKNIEFSNITSSYQEGITTIKAKVKNNTKEVKSIQVEIILKDDKGNEVAKMQQKIDNIEPEQDKNLATGIMGDYSYVKNIEMKIVE